MGVWLSANGRLLVKPSVTEELIKEYVIFGIENCPDRYTSEKFNNPWFFDSDNLLICHAGKFAEPSIWYDYIKEYFFEARGYELSGRPLFSGEGDSDFWEIEFAKEQEEYAEWAHRVREMFADEPWYLRQLRLP